MSDLHSGARLPRNWQEVLPNASIEQAHDLADTLHTTHQNESGSVCPDPRLLFKAFEATSCSNVRVVILGQDPYDRPGKACGLSFGYHPQWDGPINSSYKNIVNEVHRSIGQSVYDRSLHSWARQGVMMLNTRLSVGADKPMSHKDMGWESVIDDVIRAIDTNDNRVVWLLWGSEAQRYENKIKNGMILTSSHPCKYSATRGNEPFVGNNHFANVNEVYPDIKWGEY